MHVEDFHLYYRCYNIATTCKNCMKKAMTRKKGVESLDKDIHLRAY
jgi:hypothetical protein